MEYEQSNIKIALICDDPDTGFTWKSLLQKKGLEVWLSRTFTLKKTDEGNEPDLYIIDQTNPELNALGFIEEIKTISVSPIFLITSQNDENSVTKAYQAGVDDCVVKPISPAIFWFRVRSMLRHARTIPVTGLENLKTADFTVDLPRHTIQINSGKETHLSQLEFRLLHLLMTHPGRVFQADQIIHAVWGYSDAADNRLVKHLVFRLRHKLEADPKKPKYIKTEPGIGYKFEAE